MTLRSSQAESFFGSAHPIVRVVLTRVRGSSPREAGTEMFVSPESLFGTIGGGQLEHIVITQARSMLAEGTLSSRLDLPLGPEIGQCCGGRVELSLARMRRAERNAAVSRLQAADDALPHVYVMGAGHVGRAIANLLQHAPVHCVLVDMRKEELAQCQARVDMRLRAIPEVEIYNAPAGSAFIVLTHDHALDFLIVSAALARDDLAQVGMIGSDTKRATFEHQYVREGGDRDRLSKLTCPIGRKIADKRPEVIAATVAADIIAALANWK